jgi:hypothetical protein
MADSPTIPNEIETRARSRRPELVSAPTIMAASKLGHFARTWTLKQVQGDGGNFGDGGAL